MLNIKAQGDSSSDLQGQQWSKRQIITSVGKDVKKLEPLSIAGGNIK